MLNPISGSGECASSQYNNMKRLEDMQANAPDGLHPGTYIWESFWAPLRRIYESEVISEEEQESLNPYDTLHTSVFAEIHKSFFKKSPL
jgi:hypothetical protein